MGILKRIMGTVLAVVTVASVACVGAGAYEESYVKDYKTKGYFDQVKEVRLNKNTRALNIKVNSLAGTGYYWFQDKSWCDMWVVSDYPLIGTLASMKPTVYYSSTFYDSSKNKVICYKKTATGFGSQNAPTYHQDVPGKIAKGSSYMQYKGYVQVNAQGKVISTATNKSADLQSVRYSYYGG